MDYGVPAALGVAPELMEEVSTGVSAALTPVDTSSISSGATPSAAGTP